VLLLESGNFTDTRGEFFPQPEAAPCGDSVARSRGLCGGFYASRCEFVYQGEIVVGGHCAGQDSIAKIAVWKRRRGVDKRKRGRRRTGFRRVVRDEFVYTKLPAFYVGRTPVYTCGMVVISCLRDFPVGFFLMACLVKFYR